MVPVRGMEAVQDPEEKVRVAVRGNWPLVLGVEDCEKVRAAEPEAAAGADRLGAAGRRADRRG